MRRARVQGRGAALQPGDRKHGHANPEGAHAGDLPNLDVGPDGTAKASFVAKGVTLGSGAGSLFGKEGTSVVVHADPDDGKPTPPATRARGLPAASWSAGSERRLRGGPRRRQDCGGMLAAYVSGHGFGHATRLCEVLRAVRERAPSLPLALVGTVPRRSSGGPSPSWRSAPSGATSGSPRSTPS